MKNVKPLIEFAKTAIGQSPEEAFLPIMHIVGYPENEVDCVVVCGRVDDWDFESKRWVHGRGATCDTTWRIDRFGEMYEWMISFPHFIIKDFKVQVDHDLICVDMSICDSRVVAVDSLSDLVEVVNALSDETDESDGFVFDFTIGADRHEIKYSKSEAVDMIFDLDIHDHTLRNAFWDRYEDSVYGAKMVLNIIVS